MSLATTVLHYTSAAAYAAIAFLALLLPLGVRVIRRAWSGEHAYVKRHDPPPGWPWGAPLWRGYTRSLAVCWIATLVLVLAVVVARVAPKDTSSPLYWVAAVLLIASVVVLLVLLPAVVLLARPKLLIPPTLRRQPGAAAEWLGRGKRPRRGSLGH